MNILTLQFFLNSAGFNPGPIDGQMGRKTIAAIKAYQEARGLHVDGVVGPKTLAAIEAERAGEPVPAASAPSAPTPYPTADGFAVSSACIDCIKAWEGLEDGDKTTVNLEPYVDPVGIYTLGWGHAMADERGQWVRTRAEADRWMMRMFNKPAITRDEAKALLAQDVNDFLERLRPVLAGMPYGQGELDALVSLAFNIGVRGLSGSTVLVRHRDRVAVSGAMDFESIEAACRAGRTSGPTEYAFGAWSKAGGRWLHGLFRRRMCEAMIYRGDQAASAISVAQSI